jgi:hypothetical protein
VSQLLRTGAMASLTTSASREGNNSALSLFSPPTSPHLASNCGSPCSGIAPSIPPVQPSV